MLRASHIVPWARCGSDEERLDVFQRPAARRTLGCRVRCRSHQL
ncbi:hypothetical protein ACFSTD_00040 [Novosphingobium colocasiae]